MITGDMVRRAFLEYFEKNGHQIVSSSSLVPKDDPTLLFTNAGMVQFKKVFLGEENREYSRAASSQKCVRAGGKHNDLENVGKTARHHTFFEMLGNFSFGDYFKKEAIEFAWELLIRHFDLPKDRLWITIYKDDEEAYELWRKIAGIPHDRIARMGEKDNFWAMGDTGPCGPCSEIVFDQGEGIGCGRPECSIECDCDRYLEIWNLVFMQFNRDQSGSLFPLPKPSIDTGMGLERISAILQGKKSNYDTDLFMPIINFIEEISLFSYGEDEIRDTSMRVIADHIRGITFLLADGVNPSNEGRGYVLRRIIRRASRHGRRLNLKEPFLYKATGIVVDIMKDAYPELIQRRNVISQRLKREEERFSETLDRGLMILSNEKERLREIGEKVIPGKIVFDLYATYGFPVDLTANVAEEDGFLIDHKGFEREMKAHRELGRESWTGSGGEEIPEAYRILKASSIRTEFIGYERLDAISRVLGIISDGTITDKADEGMTIEIVTEITPFYGEAGGQVGDWGIIKSERGLMEVETSLRPYPDLIIHRGILRKGNIKKGDLVHLTVDGEKRAAIARSHSATHILQAVLRQVLGDSVHQAGSRVEPDLFRFDYTYSAPLDRRELYRIEELVNEFIQKNEEIHVKYMPYSEAISMGAMALFGEKYGDEVRVVIMGNFSLELCGGTHAKRTGDVGYFKLISDRGISSDVRRIEAMTGKRAVEYVQKEEDELREIGSILKASTMEIRDKIVKLLYHQKELEREIGNLRAKLASGKSEDLLDKVREIEGIKVLSVRIDVKDPQGMREFGDKLKERMKSGIILMGSEDKGKALLTLMITTNLTDRFNAGEMLNTIARRLGGRGGGSAKMAQAGLPDGNCLGDALEMIYDLVRQRAKG
jgi:alanyl-tRNA synthetase